MQRDRKRNYGIRDVVIIGAGFAGLSTARELSRHELDITLVEAASVCGGRVKQYQAKENWGLVDLGAEVIHGEKTVAIDLAMKYGWEVEEFNSSGEDDDCPTVHYYFRDKIFSVKDASTNSDLRLALDLVDHVICAGTKLWMGMDYKEDIERENNNETVQEWILRHYKVDQRILNIVDAVLCQTECENIENFGLLEIAENENRWECGDYDSRFLGSYSNMLDQFLMETAGVEKLMNWRAVKINWDGDIVSVWRDNGDVIQARKIVIAVPLAVLKSNCLTFSPELPISKQEAIRKLNMKPAVKLICFFRERFWAENVRICYADSGTFLQFWMYDVKCRNEDSMVYAISALATAGRAADIGNEKPAVVTKRFLQQLDDMFSSPSCQSPASSVFLDYVLYDWAKDTNIRGGYSCPSIGSVGCSDILARPVNDRLFFAGEATSLKGRATVQAAIESGMRAAEEIMNS